MTKTGLIAILVTTGIVAVILFLNSFNVQISKKNDMSANQTQAESMASHHGGGTVDTTLFDALVGKPAPDFSLEDYEGKKISLSQLKGKNVILFFNEGLMCYPACWNQIAAFGNDSKLKSKATVLSITIDQKSDWKQAIDKMPELAKATVLFDSDRQVSQMYGVLTLPSSMHKGQFPGHSYVVIDSKGTVKSVKDDPTMSLRNDEMSAEVDRL